MEFRTPQLAEEDEIRDLVVEAFGDEGPQIGELVSEMLIEPRCRLWVADRSGIEGVIGLSQASIEPITDEVIWILAPLAVKAASQRTGLGGLLVRHCLQEVENDGATGVLVYGDPEYYGRFGFSRESASHVPAPFPLEYPEGWQALWWKPVDTSGAKRLVVTEPLHRPELW